MKTSLNGDLMAKADELRAGLPSRISSARLLALCAKVYSVTIEQIKSNRRFRPFVRARQAYAYAAIHLCQESLTSIAARLGYPEHSCVACGAKRFEQHNPRSDRLAWLEKVAAECQISQGIRPEDEIADLRAKVKRLEGDLRAYRKIQCDNGVPASMNLITKQNEHLREENRRLRMKINLIGGAA